jgi:hypothetical protein
VFTAPPYAGEMQKIDELYEFSVIDFVWKTIKSLLRNIWILLVSGSAGVYFLLALIAIAAMVWWKTRSSLLLSGLIISVMLIAALMAFYSANPWYFLKQSAVLVPLLVVGAMATTHYSRVGFAMFAASLVVFTMTISSIRAGIEERKAAFDHLQGSEPFPSTLREISESMDITRPVTVLWCYNEFDFGTSTEALLPFSTGGNRPILYTTNIVASGDPPGERFRLHRKLKVDYLLSRHPLDWSNLKLLHSSQYYSFYKVVEE